MPAFTSVETMEDPATHWLLRLLTAIILCCSASVGTASGFNVSSVQPRAAGTALHVSGNLDLSLTPKVEEAVGKGIPIELVIDVRLYRKRPLIWDKRVGTWALRRELRYHALSGQYLIGGTDATSDDQESTTSLSEALNDIGALDDLTLPMEKPLESDEEYRVDLKVSLDIEALPSLLRPVAYTSRAWDLNSGWTTWKVQR